MTYGNCTLHDALQLRIVRKSCGHLREQHPHVIALAAVLEVVSATCQANISVSGGLRIGDRKLIDSVRGFA
jgi:hypothetical protein